MGALLETVSRWHQSEPTYIRECATTPGFISMMRTSGATNERVYLDYENYRHITFKWHFKITKSLVTLLESQDYMQVGYSLLKLHLMLSQSLLYHMLGPKWIDCIDKDAALLPKGVPPQHRPGEADRIHHGGGEGKETRSLCACYWVRLFLSW